MLDKKYTLKEAAEILGVTPQQVRSKITRKSFPKDMTTNVINWQNRSIMAVTGEGLEKLKDEYGITDSRVNAEDKTLLGELRLVKEGSFLGITCDFYQDNQNNIYMTRQQIGEALEYENERQLEILHERNKGSLNDLSVEVSRFEKVHQSDVGLLNQANKPLQNIKPNTLLYNEDGIYEITFLSRQPRANEFRQWVRNTLKMIRKTGGAVVDKELFVRTHFDTTSEMDVKLIVNMMNKQDKYIEEISQQKDLISELEPDAKYTRDILKTTNTMSVTTIAKAMGLHAQELNQLLHKLGIQFKTGETWCLYAPYQSCGFTKMETGRKRDSYGRTESEDGFQYGFYSVTKWTQKGRRFIYEKLNEKGLLNADWSLNKGAVQEFLSEV